ncbi:ABC transporter permease [Halomicrobium urmianum]|uniref:ABC transporter permease n=1 Tax=Halomicrobium urmianum TaxID=1586233 RepID=UPI001CDA223B|nr:ABC transporter permease [Halomicrobium urmianum]
MNGTTAADTSGVEQGNDPCGFAVLVWSMLRMSVLIMVRYRLNFAIQLVGMYAFFAIVFFGGQEAVRSAGVGSVSALGSSLDAIIVGWFVYSMAQNAYSSLSGVITAESRWGTLEQLYVSPHGFERIMGAKLIINLTLSLLMGFLMLLLMVVTTDRTLTLDAFTILPLIVLTLMSVLGLGFTFGGLTLIYKKLSSVSRLMQLALLGLVAAPAADVFALRFLPLVQGSAMLQKAMREGTRLWEFRAHDLAILVGAAVVYIGGGTLVFMVCSFVARKRGVMGHY